MITHHILTEMNGRDFANEVRGRMLTFTRERPVETRALVDATMVQLVATEDSIGPMDP